MKFECCDYDGVKWTDYLKKHIKHGEYYKLFITGRGSKIHAVMGEAEYGCGISYLNDFYWNTNKISNGLGITNAVTIAACLKVL